MIGRGSRLRRRFEHGAAAVEFALVAPLLLFFLFAIISYGYMLSFRQAISQGAAEGARAMAVAPQGLDDAEVATIGRNAINQALGSYGVACVGADLTNSGDAGDCGIAISKCPEDASRTCAIVTLDYYYNEHSLLPIFPGLGIVLPDHLRYTSVAEVS